MIKVILSKKLQKFQDTKILTNYSMSLDFLEFSKHTYGSPQYNYLIKFRKKKEKQEPYFSMTLNLLTC